MGISHSLAKPLPSSVDVLTDEELLVMIDAARKDSSTALGISDEHTVMAGATAWRITPDAVVKLAPAHEAYIMTHVASYSSVRVPHVRPGEAFLLSKFWLVMDYVDGDVLETAWPRMSWWRRLWTVWRLRKSLQELHRIPLPSPDVPGPFDSTGEVLPCSGYYFTELDAGPFESYRAMADWCDHLRYCVLVGMHIHSGKFEPHLYPTFDASQPLVLCHMDLNMRNIIVDRKGEVWLVDWGMAGAFPPWFEYANLVLFSRAAIPERRLPKSWMFFARFVAGDYRWYEEQYLHRLDSAFGGSWYESVVPRGYLDRLGLSIEYQRQP
ncbi:kinase-like domain-containing protein [Mucidula mucida]|nr:kinase-like domain-containing protein [Mucidula mucida]